MSFLCDKDKLTKILGITKVCIVLIRIRRETNSLTASLGVDRVH